MSLGARLHLDTEASAHGVVVAVIAAEMVFSKGAIGTFGGIVEPPVSAVEEEVNEGRPCGRLSHRAQGIFGKGILKKGGCGAILGTPSGPAVGVLGAEDDGVKFLRDEVFAKQRVVQFLRPVVGAKEKPQ